MPAEPDAADRLVGDLGGNNGDESVEAERARVAHELHDALLPLLFAARMHAQLLTQQVQAQLTQSPSSASLAESLVGLCGELDEAMATGRRLLVGLHPPELVAGDWHQALRHYIDRGLALGGAEVHVQLQPETAALPATQALAAYRMLQESLRNALRHGGASRIDVTAVASHGGVRLTVHDNGRGFDPTAVASDRFGLRGIRQRAARAGGQAVIQSRPGAGTTVQIDLPGPATISAPE